MTTLYDTFCSHNGKLSDKWSSNIAAYERLFAPYRDRPVRILEIGIQNGGSLEVWSKFFSEAVAIVGCDINEKCRSLIYDDPRISVVVGDVNEPAVLEQILSISGEFDIIIDDGSHVSGDIIRAFARFFPVVSLGGIFVAEDLHCSYWADYEGGLEFPGSSLSFFRRLADLTNKEHWGGELNAVDSLSYFSELFGCTFEEKSLLGVAQVNFLNSLAVVFRSAPDERALGQRMVVGQDAFVSAAPIGLDGTACPEFSQAENPFGPFARRRETLHDLISQRDATIADLNMEIEALRLSHQALQKEFHVLEGQISQRDATIADLNMEIEALRLSHQALQKEFHVLEGQISGLNQTIVALRDSTSWRITAPLRVIGNQIRRVRDVFFVLQALIDQAAAVHATSAKALLKRLTSRLLLGSRARERFAYSAAKRDPKSWLGESDPTSGPSSKFGRKRSTFSQRLEISMLRVASKLTASVSPLHSKKFQLSAQKRGYHFVEGDTSDLLAEVPKGKLGANGVGYVECHVLRCRPIGADADVLVLVLFSADGGLTDIHARQIAAYEAAGYTLVVVVNTALWLVASETLKSHSELQNAPIVIVRDNQGFDFGAWAQALIVLGGCTQARTLSFTNDSILPVNLQDLIALRRRLVEVNGALFLTANRELKPHCQSYFFGIAGPCREAAVGLLTRFEIYDVKADLIHNVEIHLSDQLRAAGMDVTTLFRVEAAEQAARNPTIHDWRVLLADGFPFIKLQLFTAGFLEPSAPEVVELLDDDGVMALEAHLALRANTPDCPRVELNKMVEPALAIEGRYSSIGAMQAYNPPADARPAIVLPLTDTARAPGISKNVLVVLHAFYPDIALCLVRSLLTEGEAYTLARFQFAVTTDTEAKAKVLRESLNALVPDEAAFDILVCPNRGRDVAPFLTACARYLNDQDLILHLHTKKSPHDYNLRDWGSYLFDCLIGSPEIIRSTMQLFDTPSLGMVFPGHFAGLEGMRNWGFDFANAQKLMERMGLSLSTDDALDFPTGTMFWARPEAIRPLIDMGLQPNDFDPEEGQTDGTLAHSIERILMYIVESSGYVAQSVVANTRRVEHQGIDFTMSSPNASAFMGRVLAKLKHFAKAPSAFSLAVPEVYDVSVGASANSRRRFNIIIPTVQPNKIFGGVSTALRVGAKLWKAHGEVDLRLIVTSDVTDVTGIAEAARRMGCTISLCAPEDDPEGATLTCLPAQRHRPLSLREGDSFLSTAWWTADLGLRLRKAQTELFGTAPKMAYLIQDYEPGFYNWSNQYAMALNTYNKTDQIIALINSEELANFMSQRYEYPSAFCVPYLLEPRLAECLTPTPKERIILVYGRPSVARNAFDIIVEGIRQWQMQASIDMKNWQIIMAGEEFDDGLLSGLENAKVVGKLSLEGYGDLLNRAGVGVSMMISPHPSYPPLEMASAGVLTITNGFEGKDLSVRSENIISITDVTPDAIAAALAKATETFVPGALSTLSEVKQVPSPYPWIDFDAVARLQATVRRQDL